MTELDDDEAIHGATILWISWFFTLIAVLRHNSSSGLMILAGVFPLNLAATVELFWGRHIRRWMQRRRNGRAPPD